MEQKPFRVILSFSAAESVVFDVPFD